MLLLLLLLRQRPLWRRASCRGRLDAIDAPRAHVFSLFSFRILFFPVELAFWRGTCAVLHHEHGQPSQKNTTTPASFSLLFRPRPAATYPSPANPKSIAQDAQKASCRSPPLRPRPPRVLNSFFLRNGAPPGQRQLRRRTRLCLRPEPPQIPPQDRPCPPLLRFNAASVKRPREFFFFSVAGAEARGVNRRRRIH
jgi:hypothetical protein